MNYWHIQLHRDDTSEYPPERIKEIIKKHPYIGMGDWPEGESQIQSFKEELKIGDIVAVRVGRKPIALVEVLTNNEDITTPIDELDWFKHQRKVRVLDYSKDNDVEIPMAMGTFRKCADLNRGTSKVIIGWYNRIKESNNMKELLKLLKTNKQIILTGAPGTGKTFLAKKLARIKLDPDTKLTEEDIKKRLGFVQFHPAYDYTDFVEGLKPVIDNNVDKGQIAFEVRAGIFMEFCEEAKRFLNDNDPSKDLPCVFIIDEINRADLSRVFGELFYALEPDYRGEKGAVSTQYKSSRNDQKPFFVPRNVYIIGTMNDIDRSVESIDFALRRRFAWYEVKADEARFDTVMNGLEVSPLIIEEAKNRYHKINEAIGAPDALGSSYQIGPAYFRKIKDYITDEKVVWEDFWKYHLELLVREYVRGRSDERDLIGKFNNAYNLCQDTLT